MVDEQKETKKVEPKQEKRFTIRIIEFYKLKLGDSARSVEELAKIQSEYPYLYLKLNEFQKNPITILDLTEKLDNESKGILFDMFIRQSILTKRLSKLMELSVEEKKILAYDLKEFAKKMESKLFKLREVNKNGRRNEGV